MAPSSRYLLIKKAKEKMDLLKPTLIDIAYLCEMLKALKPKCPETMSDKNKDLIIIIKKFAVDCINTVQQYVTCVVELNDYIEFTDMDVVVKTFIKPRIDAITTSIAKWNITGQVIDDVFKLINEFLINLGCVETSYGTPSPIQPTGSPASASVSAMSDVLINSNWNSPQTSTSSEFELATESLTVSNNCKATCEEFKKGKKPGYAIFYIRDKKQIDVEMYRDAEYDTFLEDIQKGGADKCRYGLFNMKYMRRSDAKSAIMEELVLMLWCPDTAETKNLYHKSSNVLRKLLSDETKYFVATELSEISREAVENVLLTTDQ